LVVTRGVDFSTEPNDSLATAQDIRGTGGVLGFVGGADATDFFRAATLNEGQTIHLLSSTPSDGDGEFHNTLALHLELYDSSGTHAASATPLGDGRNESLDYQVPTGGAGDYLVRVTAVGGTSGEYVLHLSVDPGTAPGPFSRHKGVIDQVFTDAFETRLAG